MVKMAVLENLGIKKNNRAIRTVKKQVIQQKLILDISHKFENQKKQILEKREEQNISFCPICRNCVSTRVFCETCNRFTINAKEQQQTKLIQKKGYTCTKISMRLKEDLNRARGSEKQVLKNKQIELLEKQKITEKDILRNTTEQREFEKISCKN